MINYCAHTICRTTEPCRYGCEACGAPRVGVTEDDVNYCEEHRPARPFRGLDGQPQSHPPIWR
jgi:hypothetical protein